VQKVEFEVVNNNIPASLKDSNGRVTTQQECAIMPLPDVAMPDMRSNDVVENQHWYLYCHDAEPIPHDDPEHIDAIGKVYLDPPPSTIDPITDKNITAIDYAKFVWRGGNGGKSTPAVYSHGSPSSICVNGSPTAAPVTAQDFTTAYNQLNAAGQVRAKTIIFTGCNVGAGATSMAQQIANGTGVTVWAKGDRNDWTRRVVVTATRPTSNFGLGTKMVTDVKKEVAAAFEVSVPRSTFFRGGLGIGRSGLGERNHGAEGTVTAVAVASAAR